MQKEIVEAAETRERNWEWEKLQRRKLKKSF